MAAENLYIGRARWHQSGALSDRGEMSFRDQVRTAQGYYELGMLEEAWEEIEAIDPLHESDPPVIQMRLLLLLKEERWVEALAESEQLTRVEPDGAMGFVHAAYCLHEMGRTADAKQRLLDGPSSLLREAVYFYNMACYEVALGGLKEAERFLRQSIEMDGNLRQVAKKDRDLKCFWELL